MDGSNETKDAVLESVQQYLAALAEDRDEAAERTHGIVARFFKVAVAIVCLNVVIAGANIAMILFRQPSSGPSAAAPAPVAAAALPAEPAPAEPAKPPVENRIPDDIAASSKLESNVPVAPEKPVVPQAPERRVPLLGTPPSTRTTSPVRTAAVLAARPLHSVPRPAIIAKPYLADEEDTDELSLARPERW
jgi:hypothetical protein